MLAASFLFIPYSLPLFCCCCCCCCCFFGWQDSSEPVMTQPKALGVFVVSPNDAVQIAVGHARLVVAACSAGGQAPLQLGEHHEQVFLVVRPAVTVQEDRLPRQARAKRSSEHPY